MENEAASADAAPERTSKRLILKKVDVLVIALALFWIFAGALKLLDLGSFSEVVATHGVVPINSPAVLSIVPVAEVLLGIFMVASVGSLQGVPILKASLLAGCVLLLSFAVYVMLVPGAVLEEVGCGCFGQTSSRLASGLPISARSVSLLVSGLLLAGHAFAFEQLHRQTPSHTDLNEA